MPSVSAVPTCPAPALLTTASREPWSATTDATTASTAAWSVTSSARMSSGNPAPRSRRTEAFDRSRIVATVVQPASAAASAVSRPMPVEVPVMRTVGMRTSGDGSGGRFHPPPALVGPLRRRSRDGRPEDDLDLRRVAEVAGRAAASR